MAFCKECGTDLAGAKFCPNCGASAEGLVSQANVGAPVGADVRQRSMADMEHMLGYFGAKEAQYDEFEKVSAEVADRSSRSFAGWIIAAVISLLIGIFATAPFFFVVVALCIVGFIFFKKQNKEKLAVATARQEELHAELEKHFKDYGYCAVGFQYTKPATLRILYELIEEGRVTNPGDAINVYKADLAQTEMLRLQQEAADAAKETAKNSKKAARYASANFWFK